MLWGDAVEGNIVPLGFDSEWLRDNKISGIELNEIELNEIELNLKNYLEDLADHLLLGIPDENHVFTETFDEGVVGVLVAILNIKTKTLWVELSNESSHSVLGVREGDFSQTELMIFNEDKGIPSKTPIQEWERVHFLIAKQYLSFSSLLP